MMLWLGKESGYQSANLEPLKGANWYIVDLPVFEYAEGVKLYFSGGHTTGHMTLAVRTNRGNSCFFTADHIHIPRELEL